jgi:hypothetical protein
VAKDRIDRDEEDLVRLYLSDIGQYTLLTKDDEVRLAQTIEEGRDAHFDPDLVDAFVVIQEQFREIALRYADTHSTCRKAGPVWLVSGRSQ